MASRAGPVIIQLVLIYFVVAFIVRAVRRARRASRPQTENEHEARTTAANPPLAARRPSLPVLPHSQGLRREERRYNGVVWQIVHRPHRDLSQGAGSRADRDEVYVEEPPRCPKCGLGVVESHSWLGYTWTCPECGTRARNSTSIEETAHMLARRY